MRFNIETNSEKLLGITGMDWDITEISIETEQAKITD